MGYERRGDMVFPGKKLRATWLAPPRPPPGEDAPLPRIFVSEVDVAALTKRAQGIVKRATARASGLGRHAAMSMMLHEPPWPAQPYADYLQLAKESEYAAWVLAHGFTANHVTVATHRLKSPPNPQLSLEEVNKVAEAQGAVLNTAGGVIKTSADGLLRQSSTMADTIAIMFTEGLVEVPGSYLEFAERLPLPEFASLPRARLREFHRRDGFEAANAEHIFLSTATQSSSKDKDAA
jgi:hypothetical protein